MTCLINGFVCGFIFFYLGYTKISRVFVQAITLKEKTNIMKKSQILEAAILGTLAFNNGTKRAPFYDVELQKFFVGREIGKTPKGEASSIEIMKAWTNSWDAANLSNARHLITNA